MTKTCIICEAEGHTYLECPRVNFVDMFFAALGATNIATGETAAQTQGRITQEMKAIEAEVGSKKETNLSLDMTDEEYQAFRAWRVRKAELAAAPQGSDK